MSEFLHEYVWAWGTPVQWAVLVVVVAIVALGWRINRRMSRFLTTAETLLALAKVYYEHGRTQHSDADYARKRTAEATEEVARTAAVAAGKVAAVAKKSAEEVKAAVTALRAELPEATAARVVEKQDAVKAGESGMDLKKPPGVP